MLRERWDLLIVISAGGALGSLARWGVTGLLPHDVVGFPWNTFVENVSGALLIGVLMALMVDLLSTTRYIRPFVGVGLLGGYTTFSTYMLDAHALLRAGRPATVLGYLAGTLAAGLVAAWAGIILGRLAVVTAASRSRRARRGEGA